MANDFSSDPWVIDSAVTGALVPGRIFIERVRWVDPSTIDHKLVLTDNNDKVVVALTCDVANKDQEVRLNRLFENGLKVATRDSGAVHLYRKVLPRQ